jgi:hypothetical protein
MTRQKNETPKNGTVKNKTKYNKISKKSTRHTKRPTI